MFLHTHVGTWQRAAAQPGAGRAPLPPRDTIHIFNVLKTNQAQTHSTCRRVAAPAPGPAEGHHSESGREGAAAAPSCPLHRGGQGPAEPGPHQQPEPGTVSIPAAAMPGRGKSPAHPWKARSTPLIHQHRPRAGAATVMPRELRGELSPDATRWAGPAGGVGAAAGRGLRACTHRQHGPQPRRHGPARLSRAEAVVGEGSALVPVTPPSPGSRSPGAPGVFGRRETPPRSCPGHGGASSPIQRRRAGDPVARARGC